MFTRESRPARIDTLIGKAARVHGDVEFQGGRTMVSAKYSVVIDPFGRLIEGSKDHP